MRWTPRGPSRNLEDRRAMGGGGFRGAGIGGLGIGGVIVVIIVSLLFGGNPFGGGGPAPVTESEYGATGQPVQQTQEEAQLVDFVSFVLDDVQEVWSAKFPQSFGEPYRESKLVLFRGVVNSGCGTAQAAMGPFYCPLDEKVYIDLGFYDELQRRFGAPGDFAQAYVLAHELGHHVQHLQGVDARVREFQQRRPDVANELSVRMELQADCYAGVWANSTGQRRMLEQGDLEEGLNAASAVGDDRIQEMATGGINPESFTHGTAQQRANWFRRGFTSGDVRNCDSFAGGI